MTLRSFLGINGSPSATSRTGILVQATLAEVAARAAGRTRLLHLAHEVPSVMATLSRATADAQAEAAFRAAETADLLVVGSPIYRGSYTGMLKHFFDLIELRSLAGTPVVLVATGGSDRHALALEHQFRPLFGFFGALTIPTAVYATEADFLDGAIASEALDARIGVAAAQAARLLGHGLARAA